MTVGDFGETRSSRNNNFAYEVSRQGGEKNIEKKKAFEKGYGEKNGRHQKKKKNLQAARKGGDLLHSQARRRNKDCQTMRRPKEKREREVVPVQQPRPKKTSPGEYTDNGKLSLAK